jgi:hypothetical protein
LLWSISSGRDWRNGRWAVSSTQPAPDWWEAIDGKWYPPQQHPDYRPLVNPPPPMGQLPHGGGSGSTMMDGTAERQYAGVNWDRPHEAPMDEPSVGLSHTSASTVSRRRSWALLLTGLGIALVCGTAFGVIHLAGRNTRVTSACSLLTSSQKSALLDAPPHVRSQALAAKGESLCTVIPWPIGSQKALTTLFLTLKPAPAEFPSALERQLGRPVEVDGRAAWWIVSVPTASVSAAPASDHFLIAKKDGRLVGAQVSTRVNPLAKDKLALADALAAI